MKIHEKIRNWRKSVNMGMRLFSIEAGIHHDRYADYESGKKRIPNHNLKKILYTLKAVGATITDEEIEKTLLENLISQLDIDESED